MVFSGYSGASWVALVVKNLRANAGDIKKCGFNPWVRKIPWGRAWQPTHSSILAWRIPRTEEPGGLQSIVSQRVRHHGSNLALTHTEYNKPFLLITNLSSIIIKVFRYLDVGFSLCFFHFKTDWQLSSSSYYRSNSSVKQTGHLCWEILSSSPQDCALTC